jgi:hypothetical protein
MNLRQKGGQDQVLASLHIAQGDGARIVFKSVTWALKRTISGGGRSEAGFV